jgi:hypothetical protein
MTTKGSQLAVETNRNDSPMLDLHRKSLASFSVPLLGADSVSRRGDLSSRAKRCDIFSPDPQRMDSESSNTNFRQVTRQISSVTASDEMLSSDIF